MNIEQRPLLQYITKKKIWFRKTINFLTQFIIFPNWFASRLPHRPYEGNDEDWFLFKIFWIIYILWLLVLQLGGVGVCSFWTYRWYLNFWYSSGSNWIDLLPIYLQITDEHTCAVSINSSAPLTLGWCENTRVLFVLIAVRHWH